MRRTVGIPFVDEPPGANAEPVAAVGIANLQNRTGHRFGLGNQQLDPAVHGLDHGKQCDRTMFHRHLHRQAASHLAVIHLERAHLGFTLRNGDVTRAVVPH